MGQILVPEWAMNNKENFTKWFCLIYNQLYETNPNLELLTNNLTHYSLENRIKIVEKIMQKVNLIMFGNNSIPAYKNKDRKVNCKIGDVLCVTSYILRTYFNMTYLEIAKSIGCISHSTSHYYVKTHIGRMNINKKYNSRFEQLITILKDEKLILYTKEVQFDAQRVLLDVLSR